MNIDREKIIKSLAVLAALFLIVGGLTQIRRHNSLSLSEYSAQHPEFTETEEIDFSEEAAEKTSSEETESASGTDTTDNLQNMEETSPVSTLTGAALNGDSAKDRRITYADSFYYEPLSDNLRRYITGVSYPAISNPSTETFPGVPGEHNVSEPLPDNITTDLPAISYDELRYVHILHYDFDGNPAEGELICNVAIAQDLVEIFYELYRNEYQLEKVLLIDEYDGDDLASMEDNNTSCFNYRVVEGTSSLSKHALGAAIDINPFYNPYVSYEKDGSKHVSPAASAEYADRSASFPYKIDENDLCYKLFKEHGFTWGGHWNSMKDYQHFQKPVEP